MEEHSKEQSPYDAAGPRPSRHLAAFAASIAAHAAIAGLIVCFVSPVARAPGEFVLAYLVQGTGGDAARGGASAVSSIHPDGGPLSTPESVSVDQRKRKRKQALADAPTRPAPIRSATAGPPVDSEHDGHWRIRDDSSGGASGSRTAAVSANGAGRDGSAAASGIDGEGGDGGGGDPNSIAHADYARNPLPAYPAGARRRAQQGTVTVRVLVGADGSVERAEVADSSGFDALDDAALETVRSRWRFVPARRGGHPVESWVLVPIRFALIEANAAR